MRLNLKHMMTQDKVKDSNVPEMSKNALSNEICVEISNASQIMRGGGIFVTLCVFHASVCIAFFDKSISKTSLLHLRRPLNKSSGGILKTNENDDQ